MEARAEPHESSIKTFDDFPDAKAKHEAKLQREAAAESKKATKSSTPVADQGASSSVPKRKKKSTPCPKSYVPKTSASAPPETSVQTESHTCNATRVSLRQNTKFLLHEEKGPKHYLKKMAMMILRR